MKTIEPSVKNRERSWYLVDAQDKVLGRLACRLADYLRGKHKPIFTPYMDMGDFIVIINAEKIRLTGNKLSQKVYYRHSGYPGGLKTVTVKELFKKRPEEIITHAVRGMLPKNSLGRQLLRKLKVYSGKEHPHQAQKPVPIEL